MLYKFWKCTQPVFTPCLSGLPYGCDIATEYGCGCKNTGSADAEKGGLCLHRPVRSDQLEQTGLFWEGDLKENEGLDGG